MKTVIYLLVLLFFVLFNSSCATKTFLEATDIDPYVRIKFADITEQELLDSGRTYEINEEAKVYYVDRSPTRLYANYVLRAVGTPVALALDTALGVAWIVGWSKFLEKNSVEFYKNGRYVPQNNQ